MTAYIEELEGVIHKLHGATATHIRSVPVKETIQGQTVWDGVVEVFDLTGHPKANRIYAWSHDTDDPANPKRYVTVLHIPPVVSPETAVRAAIAQEFRERDRTKEN
ncbi:MAG: hypothetical protein ACRD28_09950 [Acidobacteriaceae bacterium]